jgi:hypothetical protein
MSKITLFFLFASGADLSILAKCPTEQSKYEGIGAAIFFTGIFAALAAGYALFTVFDSILAATILGLVWGLMIFNLDRYIVSSMRKEGRFWREFVTASPRLVLAIAISIVIAKPLELKIFEKEINPELVVMEQQAYARQEVEIRERFEPSVLALRLEADRLKREIEEKAAHRDALVRIAQQEADGTGGSLRKNLGPIYKLKKADADKAALEFQELTQRNGQRMDNVNKQLAFQDSLQQAEIASLVRSKRDGPAARLEALSRLTAQSPPIWWANLFIILLFIIIESAPVLVKLISRSGPYDALLHTIEHEFLVQETERIAVATSETKRRTTGLGEAEQAFITQKLDAELG